MERECEECSMWEQSIYWTQFQSSHFCQILHSDFRSQLMIPRKFSDYARGKLQDKVILKGPGGTTTWEVKLSTSGDTLFLRDGWTEFVNAFSLERNDILIFKHNGNSSFNVLIFDRGRLCEKESSYFVKKCGHSRASNQEKIFLEEFTEEYLQEETESTHLKKPRKDVDGQNTSSSEKHIAPDNPRLSQLKTPYPDVKQKQKLTKRPRYASQRRQVTEDQKKEALYKAKKELTADSFLLVMRPSHVYKIFYVNIPAAWVSRNLTFKKQIVQLRTKDKTWSVRLLCLSDGRAGLCYGWRAFALENCLEESDICVFKPASLKNEPVLLDVSIVRVVTDKVKLVRVDEVSTMKSSEIDTQ